MGTKPDNSGFLCLSVDRRFLSSQSQSVWQRRWECGALNQAGLEVPTKYWGIVNGRSLAALQQQPDGGWSYPLKA